VFPGFFCLTVFGNKIYQCLVVVSYFKVVISSLDMAQSNLHTGLIRLLALMLTMICVVSVPVAEGQPPPSKAALIAKMREMRTAGQLQPAEMQTVLADLDRLPIAERRDTALLNEMLELGYRYSTEEQLALAKQIMMKKLAFQEPVRLNLTLIYDWQLLCDIYIAERNLDSARWYLSRSEIAWKEMGEPGENAYILNSKALMAENEGKYLEASQMLVQALDLLKKERANPEIAIVQVNLSRLYKILKMNEKGLKQALEAYRYFQSTNNNYLMLLAGSHIGSIYKLMDSLELAIQWNRGNIGLARSMNNETELAKGYMNLGNALSRAGQYGEALRYLDSARLMSDKLGLSYGLLLYHLNKSHNAVRMKRPEEALTDLAVFDQMKSAYPNPELELNYHEIKYKAYELLNRYEEAFRHFKISKAIKDSLDNEQAAHFLFEWETMVEKERSAKEIAELKLAVGKARLNIILMAVLSILLVGGFFFWFRARNREDRLLKRVAIEEKKKMELEVEQKNRELTSKVIINASMGDMIIDISRKLKRLVPRIGQPYGEELTLLIREMESRGLGEDWKEFETRFTQVHEDFSEILLGICPDLTPAELKVCSLLRLNMSSKEIALLTNRSTATITNTRSLIRKKLNLRTDDNLTTYLLTL
jgi:DNA-binding CsgD family transcriptional regulator